jgi:hypothetical protein
MNWFGQSVGERRDSALNRAPTIGLVNNTSDRALESTERQFLRLLRAASIGIEPEATINRLRQDALRGQRDPAILEAISTLLRNEVPPNTWHGPAARFYANWLTCIATDDFRCSHMDRKPHRGTDQPYWMDPTAVGVTWN